MKEYESIFVLDPQVDDAQVDTELTRIRDIVASGAGEITEVQKWGRRKLAYEIKKRKEGIYTLVRFTAPAATVAELNRRYRLNESLLRHLTVQYEGPYLGEGEPPAEGHPADEGDDRRRGEGRGRFEGRRRDDDGDDEE